MAVLIRKFDWSATTLGPIHTWPQSLRTATELLIRSPVPIVMLWGPEGVMIYNDAYSVFAGGRHPELLGMEVRKAWSEISDFNDNVMRVGLAGGTLSYRDQALTLNRRGVPEPVWMDLDYSPVPDESGAPAGVIAIVVETTKRVLAEQRAQTERVRLLQTFEQAPGFIVVMRGPEHIVDFVNAAHRRAFSSDNWIGMPLRAAFPDLAGQGYFELLDQVYATGERYVAAAAVVRFRQPDGRLEDRFLSFVYEAMRGDNGEIIGVLCEGSDVTEAHRAQQALTEETRVLETLNRTGAAVAAELDLENLVQMVSDAGVELTGAQFGAYFHNVMDESGERLHLFTLSGADRDQFVKLGRPRATAVFGPTFRDEGVIRSDDILQDARYGQSEPHRGMPRGHLPVRSYLAASVVSRSGKVLGGLLFGHQEIGQFTERHERLIVGLAAQAAIAIDNARLFQAVQVANETLEQRVVERTAELVQAQDSLRQAQKMEAVGQLTGGLAHDFNNLLAGISGSLELIERRISQGRITDLQRFLEGAKTSAQRAAALTQRLLAFSRRQTLDPKPTDVNRLVSGMEDLIRRTVGPGISLEVVGAAGLWLARVDAPQLENALLNLAINARDAMPEGGRITIETANKFIDSRAAHTHELPPGQYLSVCVTDNGAGMARDVVERIFDPFFTTKPIGQGTGLGLSMVHGFVRQSGGQVRAYSEVGQGTTICLYLPKYSGPVGEEVLAGPDLVPEGGAGETVLIIDDEAIVRVLMVEVCHEAGFQTIEAEDGPSGLNILRSEAKIDLLVTDVGLPGGMNGRQVADAARVIRPGLKVLFVTGFAENAAVGNGHLEAGMAVITKPFAVTQLATKICEMIQGG